MEYPREYDRPWNAISQFGRQLASRVTHELFDQSWSPIRRELNQYAQMSSFKSSWTEQNLWTQKQGVDRFFGTNLVSMVPSTGFMTEVGLPFGPGGPALGASKVATATRKILKPNTVTRLRGGFSGHKGFELRNTRYQSVRNQEKMIQDRFYSGHVLDQMQNRGFTPSVIEHTIKNGLGEPNKILGRVQYYDPINNISVVTENSRVITSMYGKVK